VRQIAGKISKLILGGLLASMSVVTDLYAEAETVFCCYRTPHMSAIKMIDGAQGGPVIPVASIVSDDEPVLFSANFRDNFGTGNYAGLKVDGWQIEVGTSWLDIGSGPIYDDDGSNSFSWSYNDSVDSYLVALFDYIAYDCVFKDGKEVISNVYDLVYTNSVILPKPVKQGYDFQYWLLGDSTQFEAGSSCVGSDFGLADAHVDTNVILSAVWNAKSYDVAFDSVGGECSTKTKTVVFDKTYGELPTPYRTGNVFEGWYTQKSGGTKIESFTKVAITANQTLYAHWTANSYTVTLDYNQGSGTPASITVTYDSTYANLPKSGKRTGYTFAGWYTAASGGDEVLSTNTVNITANQTLYAHWTANPYTVTLNYNHDEGSQDSISVTYDSTYANLPKSGKRTGYTFAGWYTAASGGDKVLPTDTVKITANQTLYAHWTANSYTVTLDYNQGSGTPDSITVTYDSTYKDLPTTGMSRTGYTFAGWYTDPVNGEQVLSSVMVKRDENHTLYAHWTAVKYKISFDPKGGTGSCSDKEVVYGEAYGTLPLVTLKGHGFDGWYTEATGGILVSAATVMATASNHTLYAHWTPCTYTVRFDLQEGTGTATNIIVTFGKAYGELPMVTRTGYGFSGWYTAASGGLKIESTTTVSTDDNHVLFARWTKDACMVAFDLNYVGAPTPPDPITVKFDDKYGTLPSPSRTGYSFTGWFTDKEGGTQIKFDSTVKVTGNQTLYAQWEAKSYTLNFNAMGGAPAPAAMSVTFGKAYGDLPEVSKDGNGFLGWFTAKEGGTEVTSATVVDKAENHTIYAHWQPRQYTVGFEPHGGSGSPTNIVVTYGLAYPELPVTSKLGNDFQGWYTAESGGTRVKQGDEVKIAGDHILHAIWKVGTYIVTLDYQTGLSNTVSVTYGSKYPQLPTSGTRTGYEFVGWYTDPVGGTEVTTATTVTTPSNHTLYAHWTARTYTVTLDYNEGSGKPASISVIYDSTYADLSSAVMSRTGYTFVGWYTQKSGGNKVLPTDKVQITAAQTLYAHWEPAKYTVDFELNGGLGTVTNITVTYNAKYPELPQVSHIGYASNGWWTAEGVRVRDGVTTVTTPSNHTLYAEWTANDYRVVFNANGGAGAVNPVALKYDQVAVLTNKFEHALPYDRFLGWRQGTNATDRLWPVDVAGTQVVTVSNLTAKAGEEVTLYAEWGISPGELSEALGCNNLRFEACVPEEPEDAQYGWKPNGSEYATSGGGVWKYDRGLLDLSAKMKAVIDERTAGTAKLTFEWRPEYAVTSGDFYATTLSVELGDEIVWTSRNNVATGEWNSVSIELGEVRTDTELIISRVFYAGDYPMCVNEDDRCDIRNLTWTVIPDTPEPTPGDAPVISGVVVSGGKIGIGFVGDTRFDYQLYRTDSLSPIDWLAVGDRQSGTGSAQVIECPIESAKPSGFYKVEVLRKQ